MNSSATSMNDSDGSENQFRQVCPETSADLKSLAVQSLEASPMFRGRLAQGVIQIDAQGDSLVLTGKVPTYYVKQLLQETLRRVDGVKQIENQICVLSAENLMVLNGGKH